MGTMWLGQAEKPRSRIFSAFVKSRKNWASKLLRNESIKIQKGNSSIDLIGVENWGKGFAQYGDLNKATANLEGKSFKILMSHDPSHFDEVVKKILPTDPSHPEWAYPRDAVWNRNSWIYQMESRFPSISEMGRALRRIGPLPPRQSGFWIFWPFREEWEFGQRLRCWS